MSHTRISIGVAENGSIQTASRSGFRIMSDSLMAFQPSIDEPSNMKPSLSSSSPTTPATMVRCCHLPLGSVKRRSTHSISLSLIILRTSDALFAMMKMPFPVKSNAARWPRKALSRSSDRVGISLPGTDADAVSTVVTNILPSPMRPVCAAFCDRFDHALGERIVHDDLQLHLGQEIDDIFGTAIEFGMPFWRPKPRASVTVMPLTRRRRAAPPSPHRA
jgi:hypothetical protein